MVKTFWYHPDYWMDYDKVGDNKKTLDMWINYIEKEYFAEFRQVVSRNLNGATMCLFKLRKPRFLAKSKLRNESVSLESKLKPV